MTYHDKLLSVALTDNQTIRTYTAFRIDYDSSKDVSDLLPEGEDVESYFTGGLKNPSESASGYNPKTDYQRIVLVEDATTRDEVLAELDANSITYVTEDVSPTQAEKDAMEYYDVTSASEIEEAVQEHHNSLNRSRISSASKDKLRTDIGNVSDTATQDALSDVFEILTGDEI